MTSGLLSIALLAALAGMLHRQWRRARRERAARQRPGADFARPIAIESFADMDAHLDYRPCACGNRLRRTGEGPRIIGGRHFRVARLMCEECERVEEVFFDTTAIRH